MANNNQHIIGKVSLELNLENQSRDFDMINKQQLRLVEKIAEAIDSLAISSDQVISIDQLTIDVGRLRLEDFANKLTLLLKDSITKEIAVREQNPLPHESSFQHRTWKLFISYLRHGYLPWNVTKNEDLEFEIISRILLDGDSAYISEFQTTIKDPKSLYRFCFETPVSCLNSLLKNQVFSTNIPFQKIKDELNSIAGILLKTHDLSSQEREIRFAVFSSISNFWLPGQSASKLHQENKIHFNPLVLQKIGSRIHDTKSNIPDDRDEANPLPDGIKKIYVNNAGIIILHPFLLPLFKELNLCDDKSFHSLQDQEKAVSILQHLCALDPLDKRHLSLNKVLCGLAPDTVIPYDFVMNEQLKQECAKLLNSVIKYWSALKNTSIEGIQTSFLQREGLLEVTDQQIRLIIEKKSFDILMEKLPWPIHLIKLPWMKTPLWVEW